MSEARIGIRIAEDRQSVVLEVAPKGERGTPVELSLEQFTNLIALLGEARHHMVEGRPVEPLEGKNVRTVMNPNWYIQVAQIDGSLLAFDHPGFGPIAFAIPRQEVAKIVRLLSAHLALPSTPPTTQS